MRPCVDWRLYLVTDRALAKGRALEDVVWQAVEGGATAVQLREKGTSTDDCVALARRLLKVLRPCGVPLIVNDSVDVALAADADGVHLGQRDVAVADARRRLGPDRLIGLSVETLAQAAVAEAWDVDYLGVSPIFDTPTKTDTAAAWGLEGLRTLRAATRRTLVAIGGVNAANAAEVVVAGADGIAVVSAVCAADDPSAAARSLRRAVDEALGRRRGSRLA